MSPLGTKWRAIYGFMDYKGYNCEQAQYPKFDNTKHNLLCSELKHLYVAITRAKQRLWIYEDNPQNAKPMVDYWNKMSIIQSKCLDRAMLETMYVASNSEEWKKKGIKVCRFLMGTTFSCFVFARHFFTSFVIFQLEMPLYKEP